MKISAFLFAAVGLLVLDLIWIGGLMKGFYLQHLGHLARVKDGGFDVVIWAAVPVYILLATGITAFVLPRASDVATAFAWGALFGICVYGVYDFTNLATLRDYSIKMTLVDICWGGLLCGIVAAASKKIFG